MARYNLAFWIVGLALQCILLTQLLARRIAKYLPIFTILIGFYVVRSTILYSLSSRLGVRTAELTFGGLAIIDFALQIAVAWELLFAKAGSDTMLLTSAGTLRDQLPKRLLSFSILILISVALTAIVLTQFHTTSRAPLDRGVLFTSALFLAIFVASFAKSPPLLMRRIAGGFALYAGVSIVCQIERAAAAVRRDVTAFNDWSYIEAASYLVAVLVFIIACEISSRIARHLPETQKTTN